MSTKTVKPFVSARQSVLPAVRGDAGSLLAALRIVLVTGGGAQSVSTLTVSGGVATATFATAHGYIVDSVIEVAGADQTALNGEFRVSTVPGPNAITFPVDAVDGTGTGSITCRLAPAGWEEVFTGTNVAVFRPTHLESSRFFVRVDDTGGNDARVTCYESMSDINTGTNAIPTNDQLAGGVWWSKNVSTNGNRAWVALADHRGVYFGVACRNTNVGVVLNYVGEIKSRKPGDPWAWLLTGNRGALTTNFYQPMVGGGGRLPTDEQPIYMARNTSGSTPPELHSIMGQGYSPTTTTQRLLSGGAGYSQLPAYPNPAGGALLLCEVEVLSVAGVRGLMPGLLHARQQLSELDFPTGVSFASTADALGRRLLPIAVGDGRTDNGFSGEVFFDVTDTWERHA